MTQTFDAPGFDRVFGGHPNLMPLFVSGLYVRPPRLTESSQATGAGSTALRAYVETGVFSADEGREVKELHGQEVAVITENNHLTLDQAVWFVAVLVKRAYGALVLQWIEGTKATGAANAVLPTTAAIVTAVGQDSLDRGYDFVILGAIRYHRSADTVITTAWSDAPRSLYTDETHKTMVLADPAAPGDLGYRFWGFVRFGADLTQMSGVGAAAAYLTGVPMPDLPLGGFLGKAWGYQPQKNGGAGAVVVVRLQISGVDVTGNDLTMAAASTAIPAVLKAAVAFTGDTHRFKRGDTLGLYYVSETTPFNAGFGEFFVPVYEYVP